MDKINLSVKREKLKKKSKTIAKLEVNTKSWWIKKLKKCTLQKDDFQYKNTAVNSLKLTKT